ncbi:MAG TPA: hypothetical protein VF223_00320 [Trebonia sp.]
MSYLKAAAYEDGHPGNSDPLDEQTFIVDGSNDATQDAAICTSVTAKLAGQNDRCGFSQRLPFVVPGPHGKPARPRHVT